MKRRSFKRPTVSKKKWRWNFLELNFQTGGGAVEFFLVTHSSAHQHRRRLKLPLNRNACTLYSEYGVNRRRAIHSNTDGECVSNRSVKYVNTSARHDSARHDYSFFDFMHITCGVARPKHVSSCYIYKNIKTILYIYLLVILMRTALLIESQFPLILLASSSSVRASAFCASAWFSCLLLASLFSGAKNGENVAFSVGWGDSMPCTYGTCVKPPVKNFFCDENEWENRNRRESGRFVN